MKEKILASLAGKAEIQETYENGEFFTIHYTFNSKGNLTHGFAALKGSAVLGRMSTETNSSNLTAYGYLSLIHDGNAKYPALAFELPPAENAKTFVK